MIYDVRKEMCSWRGATVIGSTLTLENGAFVRFDMKSFLGFINGSIVFDSFPLRS